MYGKIKRKKLVFTSNFSSVEFRHTRSRQVFDTWFRNLGPLSVETTFSLTIRGRRPLNSEIIVLVYSLIHNIRDPICFSVFRGVKLLWEIFWRSKILGRSWVMCIRLYWKYFALTVDEYWTWRAIQFPTHWPISMVFFDVLELPSNSRISKIDFILTYLGRRWQGWPHF